MIEHFHGLYNSVKSRLCLQLLEGVLQPLLNNLASFLTILDEKLPDDSAVASDTDPKTTSPAILTAEFGKVGTDSQIEREMEVLEVRKMPDGVMGLCCEEKPSGAFVKVALREGKSYELTGKMMKVQMRPVFSVGEYLRLVNYVYKPAREAKGMGCYQTYLFTRSPKQLTRKQPANAGTKPNRISLGFSFENIDPRHFLDTSPGDRRNPATIINKSDTKSPLKTVGVQGSLNISSSSRDDSSTLGLTRAIPRDLDELGLTAMSSSRQHSSCEKKRRINCVCCNDALEGCSDLIRAHGKHQFVDGGHTPEGYWDLHFMETQKER